MTEQTISGFRFEWDEKQKNMDKFDEFVGSFVGKFKLEQTNEEIKILSKDVGSGKVIKLQKPIKLDNNKDIYLPFGDNVKNSIVHIADRTEESGKYFHLFVKLTTFLNFPECTVPTIVIWFQGPFLAVSSYDVKPFS